MSSTSEIEKVNLEAHVEICAVRYHNLDLKLGNLEGRMGDIEQKIEDLSSHLVVIKDSLTTRVSKSSEEGAERMVRVLLTILGILGAGLIGFISKGLFN